MKTKMFFCSFLVTLLFQLCLGQSLVLWSTGPTPALENSALLQMESTDKGVLLPRMTNAQRAAIPLPKESLIVYSTDDSCFTYFNGLNWILLKGSLSTTSVPVVRTYTTNATWTKPFGLKYITVELVGGGGGGGGCGSYGGGAGAGAGYTRKIIGASALDVTESISIGLGGSGGPAETTGQTGGTTSFGIHCSATGGEGGKDQEGTNGSSIGSLPGTGINGDINANGQSSGGVAGTGPQYGGGSSIFGGGAPPNRRDITSSGTNATGYGSGGAGAVGNNGGTRTGGNGSGGIVIITEYY